MKRAIAILLPALCALTVSAQDNCYFPTQKGAELTYKYYNNRGKALKNQWSDERWMKFLVEDVWWQEDGVTINVGISNEIIERLAKNERFKSVAESLSYGDVKIEGGQVTLDNMQWLADIIPTGFLYILGDGRKFEGQKYSVDLTSISSFPQQIEIGDTLPDEDILNATYSEILTDEEMEERDARIKEMETMRIAVTGDRLSISSDIFKSSVTAKTRGRKVEAFEKVTTPAGTFDCYKIVYEMVIPEKTNSAIIIHRGDGAFNDLPPHLMERGAGEHQSVKYADWMSPEVGLVKREKYNGRGKVQEMMQLESYKK